MIEVLAIELFGLSGGPLAAVAFVTTSVLLLTYAGVSGARRKRALEPMMLGLGFARIEKPDPGALVPDELFYPNGFVSQEKDGGYGSILPRVPVGWSGWVGGREVVVMDVSITRSHAIKTNKVLDRTVIRFLPTNISAPNAGSSDTVLPPDFMIHEWPLFKNQIRGARAIGGPAEIGTHYYLFSDAPDEALVPWITTALRDQLAQHRRWTIATHDGVFFLSRNTARQRPGDMQGFLAEGEALMSGLLAGVDRE